jgi:Transcriptional regulators
MNGEHLVTIWDVAKLAGVSKSTVSRVMNNGSTSEEARKAVFNAIEQLNYKPSCFAKNIRTQRSMTIAMMIPDASNLFYTEMYKAVEQVIFENEYMVILCDTQNSTDYEIKYAEKLLDRKADGLIYCTYKKNERSERFFINLSKKLPIVFMDFAFANVAEKEGICLVATEGYNSTCEAFKFLYEKGRRKIAYINFPNDTQITLPRFEGYLKGLSECGLPYRDDFVYFPEPEQELNVLDLGYLGARKFMSAREVPDAIMVAADPLAIGAMKYLKEKKIKIPEDISIIGFDNNDVSKLVEPNLTTIAQPIKELGSKAAQLLIGKLNGLPNTEERIILEGKMIQRGTT